VIRELRISNETNDRFVSAGSQFVRRVDQLTRRVALLCNPIQPHHETPATDPYIP